MTLWWLFWLMGVVTGRTATRAYFQADTLNGVSHSDKLDIVSLAVDIVAAMLAILVVHHITSRQLERAQSVEALA